MDSREIERLKKELLQKVCKIPDKKFGKDDKTSDIWKNYAMSNSSGKAVYQSMTDEELLSYLRETAKELNHAPSQNEVFWPFRDYIKTRFQKWPYALRKAGLSSSAGKGGRSFAETEKENRRREELLSRVREKARQMGKIPHPKDMPDVCEELKSYYTTWNGVIGASGISTDFFSSMLYKIGDLEPSYQAMLKEIKEKAYTIGRCPLHREIDESVKKDLIKRCGSWRNVLYQIDLKPIMRMQPFYDIYIDYRKNENRTSHTDSLYGCYYEILNLTENDKKLLSKVQEIYDKRGSLPMKKDVPKELRQNLLKRCGSWGNVLYQIGISPKTYYEEKKKRPENRKKQA